MSKRAKIWTGVITALLIAAALGAFLLYRTAKNYAAKVQPYIRQQAIDYLSQRFDAQVEIGAFEIDIPPVSPLKLYETKGAGVIASVTGRDISLRRNQHPNLPPVLLMKSMRFEVDLGQLDQPHKSVTTVYLDGMTLTVPPRGAKKNQTKEPPGQKSPPVTIGQVFIQNADLVILPRDPKKRPLEFALHRIHLQHAGVNAAMKYDAELRNAKPPGEIIANGNFGPWNRDDPGDTPLDGDYKFEHADLGVFSAIGGLLNSTGNFQGVLSSIAAKGEASVPDFYLKSSGNHVPLHTRFEVEVDGTNGDTILKPVHGRLGKTSFVTSGGIIRREGDRRKSIDLDLNMPAGRIEDLLLLAMKGNDPFMSGVLNLKSRISVPPLDSKVVEKLRLKGKFEIKDGKFLRSQMQDRIDQMSRQAQGQPKNMTIDEVLYGMTGSFDMANQSIRFSDLAFGIPGADLRLDGSYDIDSEVLDFHGDLRLQAKLSQTQSGWKRWALKPVDPFFAKNGAGLYTKIQITGTRKEPKFGREK